MKNRTIRDRYLALATLSRRTLPGATAVNKVSVLLGRYGPAFQATERSLEACYVQHPAPDDMEPGDKLPEWLAERRVAFNSEVLEQSQSIKKVPDQLLLTSADMPRALSGEDGAKNAAGLAEIRHMLGGLYKPSGDEILDMIDDQAEDAG